MVQPKSYWCCWALYVVNSKRAMPSKHNIQIDIAGVDGANHSFKITFLSAVKAADRMINSQWQWRIIKQKKKQWVLLDQSLQNICQPVPDWGPKRLNSRTVPKHMHICIWTCTATRVKKRVRLSFHLYIINKEWHMPCIALYFFDNQLTFSYKSEPSVFSLGETPLCWHTDLEKLSPKNK